MRKAPKKIDHDCNDCRYETVPFGFQPCLSCIDGKERFSCWEPKPDVVDRVDRVPGEAGSESGEDKP